MVWGCPDSSCLQSCGLTPAGFPGTVWLMRSQQCGQELGRDVHGRLLGVWWGHLPLPVTCRRWQERTEPRGGARGRLHLSEAGDLSGLGQSDSYLS